LELLSSSFLLQQVAELFAHFGLLQRDYTIVEQDIVTYVVPGPCEHLLLNLSLYIAVD